MTFLIDVILQVIVSVVVPLSIIKAVYAKTGKIRKIIILPFFILDWLMRAFTAVLFFGTMNNFFEWLCDACVFVLPIVATCLSNRVCSDVEVAQDTKETTTNMANTTSCVDPKGDASCAIEITSLKAVPQLSCKLDGKFVHVEGSFTVDEKGYRINILHTDEPLVISSSIPAGIYPSLPKPFDINTWLEIIPAPTSNAANWKKELDQNYRYLGAEKSNPIPSVFGRIRYIDEKHYQILGAYSSLEGNSLNKAFVESLAKDNHYLLPGMAELAEREKLTNSFNPTALQYGLIPTLPICLQTIKDVKAFVELIRDGEGHAYWCRREPSSVRSVDVSELGILHIYEYSLKSLVGEKTFSIFICPYGTLVPQPGSKIYAPFGYNLSYAPVTSHEDLFKAAKPVIEDELVNHFNAKICENSCLLYLPTDDGYSMMTCAFDEILREAIDYCCKDDAELTRLPANEAVKRIRTKLVYKFYEKYASDIRWVLPKRDRECIERANEPLYKLQWSEAYINYQIGQASEKNLKKLIEDDVFAVSEIASECATNEPSINPVESDENAIQYNKLFCRKCGAELFSDSVFCHKCGTGVIK